MIDLLRLIGIISCWFVVIITLILWVKLTLTILPDIISGKFLPKLYNRLMVIIGPKLDNLTNKTSGDDGCPNYNDGCKMDTSPVIKAAELTIRTLKIRKAQEIEGLSPCYSNSTMFGFAEKITPSMCSVCSYRHTCDCKLISNHVPAHDRATIVGDIYRK